MRTKLEVSLPGEADRHFPIEGRAIVGKGPTADVSLDGSPNVSAQHFRIKLGPENLDVRLAPGARPLTYQGQPFSGGIIPYGSDFYLERIRLSVSKPKPQGNSKTLPLLLVTLLVLAGLGVMMASDDGPADPGPAANDADVVLFSEAAACPASDTESAARKAANLERAAETKRERYRYAAHDGLDAGRLFADSSKCYALAGDIAGRARVDQAGEAWRQRITDEFRAAQIRLQTAMQNKQYQVALEAVLSMRRMLAGESIPYAAWLLAKQRQISSEMEKIKKSNRPYG